MKLFVKISIHFFLQSNTLMPSLPKGAKIHVVGRHGQWHPHLRKSPNHTIILQLRPICLYFLCLSHCILKHIVTSYVCWRKRIPLARSLHRYEFSQSGNYTVCNEGLPNGNGLLDTLSYWMRHALSDCFLYKFIFNVTFNCNLDNNHDPNFIFHHSHYAYHFMGAGHTKFLIQVTGGHNSKFF